MSTTNLETAPLGADPEFTFRFLAFDSGRRQVRIVVIVDGVEDDVVWMCEKDIRNHLEIFGQHPALLTALAYYTGAIPILPAA